MILLLLVGLLLVWAIIADVNCAGSNYASPSHIIGGASPIDLDLLDTIEFTPYYHPTIDNLKRLKYFTKPDWLRINIHLGQRKLLCSEVEFITLVGKRESTIVYAGSAPGYHTVLLAQMFPRCKFILYDPLDFSEELNGLPNVEIHQEFFTDDIARKYRNKNVLFISDIRTVSEDTAETGGDHEFNMEQQRKWVEIMEPIYSMLKFKLPWKPGKTKYLAGRIYTQAWSPPASAETRLITDGRGSVLYDNKEYEEKLHGFQVQNRTAWHDHSITTEGVDHCYDCWREINIIRSYLKRSEEFLEHSIAPTDDNVITYIKAFNRYGGNITRSPHGLYPNLQNTHERVKLLAAQATKDEKIRLERRAKFRKTKPNTYTAGKYDGDGGDDSDDSGNDSGDDSDYGDDSGDEWWLR